MHLVLPVLVTLSVLTIMTSTQALEARKAVLQAQATQTLKITVQVPVHTALQVTPQQVQSYSNVRHEALMTEAVESTSGAQTKVYTATAL